MKIQIADIEESPKVLVYDETVEELNARLASGTRDYWLERAFAVELSYYRSGGDLFFHGSLRGDVRATCGRCLEEYGWPLAAPLTIVLSPRRAADTTAPELSADDLALGFYEGTEIDLTPLVHEQVLLTLPMRPLCREDCRGLCTRCGADLNVAPCGCATMADPPRLAVLRDLVRSR